MSNYSFIWEAIGWASTLIVIISMMQTRIMRLRVINLIGCLGQIVYNAIIGAWPVVGLNTVLAIIQIINIWRLKRAKHDEASYSVIVTQPASDLVSQVIYNNREDIRKFNPSLEASRAKEAFVIMRGNEVVGLTISKDEDPYTAHLLLDYVTEKYRDCTPGEFLFNPEGWFARRGYRKVTANVGGPDYYDRVGFVKENDQYVKVLVEAK